MSDLDQLRPSFDALRNAVLPAIHPPGVAAARRTLRRRRRNRTAMGVAAAVVGIAGLAGLLLRQQVPPGPAIETTSGPPAVTVPEPDATVAPSAPGSPSPHAAAPPSAGQPSTAPPARRPTPTSTCQPKGIVDLVDSTPDNWYTVSARVDGRFAGQLCPDERARVFWVSYTVDPGGDLQLFRSGEYFLDDNAWTARFHVDLPRMCSAAFYVVYGNAPIVATVPGGSDPYPQKWLTRNTYPPCPSPFPG